MPRILIIDDEKSLRTALRRALDRAGYQTVEAGDGRAGLKELAAGNVDLVITDIIMPGMEGIELMFELRRTHSVVPIIAMTGGGVIQAGQYLQLAKSAGAIRQLTKPFSIEHLLAEVADVLGKPPSTSPPPGPAPAPASPA